MQYFLCKLVPPRPTFDRDMTDAEGKLMQEHIAYWAGLAHQGIVIVFGPVSDPKGAWGVAILELESEADVHPLTASDPVTKSGLGFGYEIYSMPRVILRNMT